MKKHLSLSACLFVFFNICLSQDNLPAIKLKNIEGKEIDLNSFVTKAKDTPVVVSFWATWCVPCIAELENINDNYDDWQKQKPFKFIGVAIDDSRTAQRVKSFTKGKGWKFDVWLDINSDLKRAVNVTDVPHVLIIQNGKIVYRHTGYIAGDEDNLLEKIKTL